MVDTEDIFRRLTSGAQFNRQKLNRELAFIRGRVGDERDGKTTTESVAAALDFFGDLTSGERPGPQEERDGERGGELAMTGERKRVTGVSRKRKRTSDKNEEECIKEGRQCESGLCEDSEGESGEVGEGGLCESGEGESGEEEGEVEVLPGQSVSRKRKRKKQKKRKRTLAEQQSLMKREEANAFRNAHKIYVSGSDIPDAVPSFAELYDRYNLPSYLKRNITTAGYLQPTPVQMQAIPLMLHGREVLACAPTGSGKTAAFIIPILVHLKEPVKAGFRAVIVSPTRELAQQTHRECVRLSAGSGFKVHVLTKAKASANNFGPSSSQRFDILVTTPNRLVHMLSQEPPTISLSNVEWLVLDEADKLFEDGPNDSGFREQVSQIYSACDNPNVKHALFSATLGAGVEEFCHAYFTTPVRIIVGIKNTATDAVKQELVFVGQESGKLLAVRNLVKKGFTPPLLVFVQSKDRAKELFHELIYDGLNVEVIHADRTQAQRDNIIKSFRAGRIWVLICTDLMGRGIDFKGVNTVINYDFPPSAISYIHRIGRTGRAGRQGQAITFFTEDDAVNLRSIADLMRSSGCDVPNWMLKMKRPSKATKKRLSQRPLKRDSITTATRYDLQRAKKKKEMVLASKHRTNISQ